jgi:hypothetical protein
MKAAKDGRPVFFQGQLRFLAAEAGVLAQRNGRDGRLTEVDEISGFTAAVGFNGIAAL